MSGKNLTLDTCQNALNTEQEESKNTQFASPVLETHVLYILYSKLASLRKYLVMTRPIQSLQAGQRVTSTNLVINFNNKAN